MNLRKKKELAARVLRVGKDRIVFLQSRLDEIKEAITKQDIRGLRDEGAIVIKEKGGRKKLKKRVSKSPGNIKKRVKKRKHEYIIMTRKLRSYVNEMKKQEKITGEEAKDIRKKIRNKIFKSKNSLKEYIGGLHK